MLVLKSMQEELKTVYGSWALVAGAAEGLGRAYSMELAARGLNLILVDINKNLLDKLCKDLQEKYQVQLKILHLDLASGSAPGRMMEVVRETGCRLLVYNAAFSKVQRFLKNDQKKLDQYMQVNIRTPLLLVHSFCNQHHADPGLRKGIILMSSLAGSWGSQLLGPYGGSKAFSHILAESLHHELKDEGFDVLACIAGPTSTPGYLASLPSGKEKAISVMPPDKVVLSVFRALGRRAFVVPGAKNKFNYFVMTRLLPRRASLKMMNRAVGKLYRE